MKRFLLKLLLFAVPLFLIALPMDVVVSRLLSQSHQYEGSYEVWNDIHTGKAGCQLAVYGSSRAWMHMDPAILKDLLGLEVYNLGISGNTFPFQYLMHLEYLRHNLPPSVIVLSLDIFTLERSKKVNTDIYLPFMLGNEPMRRFLSSQSSFVLADSYLPMLRYYGRTDLLSETLVQAGENPRLPRYRYKGFRGQQEGWDTSKIRHDQQQRGYYRFEIDSVGLKLLHQFASECRQGGIDLILVYSPDYIEGREYITNRSEIMALYREFARSHQLPFLDYSGSSICLDKALFYNPIHLNGQGATVFSRMLAHDLKRLLVAGQ